MKASCLAVVHNEPVGVESLYSEASRDVLEQVQAVQDALARRGIEAIPIAFTRDLRSFVDQIEEGGIRFAFNLCESVDENPRLASHPAAVMDLLGISYSGSPAMALALTTDKLLTKRLLRTFGMKTPRYETFEGADLPETSGLKFPIIVKPRFEDASVGIDQESIFNDQKKLNEALGEFYRQFGPLILEEYIPGREFNVSLLGYPSPRVLPIAEICFDHFPEGAYPIVGYKAKWDKNSFEYEHTPRVFPSDLAEAVEREISGIALHCYRSFMLRDYARVDLRVDSNGVVYVLEINANPCISPDAGFPAALLKAGIGYEEFIDRLFGYVRNREQEVRYASFQRERFVGYKRRQ